MADVNSNHGLDLCCRVHRLGEIGIESLSKANSSKNWLYLIYCMATECISNLSQKFSKFMLLVKRDVKQIGINCDYYYKII